MEERKLRINCKLKGVDYFCEIIPREPKILCCQSKNWSNDHSPLSHSRPGDAGTLPAALHSRGSAFQRLQNRIIVFSTTVLKDATLWNLVVPEMFALRVNKRAAELCKQNEFAY